MFMKRTSLVLAAVFTVMAASAAEYTINVASGLTHTLKSRMESDYPGVSLQFEDTIIKTGEGVLNDNANDELTAGTQKLTIEVREGAFKENISRKGCTYSVSAGAAMVLGVSFDNISASDNPVTFNLAGSGTAAYPGALYYNAPAGANNQYIVYNLTDDTVIYHAGSSLVVNFSSHQGGYYTYNRFTMNKHTLTFRSSGADSKIVRCRFNMAFVDPGTLVFDNVSFSRTRSSYDYGIRAYKADGTTQTKLPLLKAVNGACINIGSEAMASNIAAMDFEYGTRIGYPTGADGIDVPAGSFTIPKLVGSPSISADSAVTIDQYVAKAADIAADHVLSSALALSIGSVTVDCVTNVAKGASHVIAQSDVALNGDCANPYVAWSTVTKTATALSWERTGERTDSPDDYLVLVVPADSVVNYATATAGYSAEDLEAKATLPMLVTGGGKFVAGGDTTNYGGARDTIVVSEGEFYADSYQQFPRSNGVTRVIVESGATLRIGFDFSYLRNSSYGNVKTYITAAGTGLNGRGAVEFGLGFTTAAQDVTWTLTDDALFTFNKAGVNCFSNWETGPGGARSQDSNRFVMNGHKLTFKNAVEAGATASECYVRFRYTSTFVNPGEIVFDGIGFTKLSSSDAQINVFEADGTTATKIPKVSFINGARFNPSDTRLAGASEVLDFAYGTTIGQIGSSDTAQNNSQAHIAGAPAIETVLMTIPNYTAHAADLVAGHCITSVRNLTITDFEVDDRTQLPYDIAYTAASVGADAVIPSVPGNRAAWLTDLVLSADSRTLTLTRNDVGDENQYFFVNVPAGEKWDWVAVSNSMTAAEYDRHPGKIMVKTGKGILYPNGTASNVMERVSALRIAEGTYQLLRKWDLPRTPKAGDEPDDVIAVTVERGATLTLMTMISDFCNNGLRLHITAGGSGVDAEHGAVSFASVGGSSGQNAVFTLTDDTIFTVSATGVINFSNLEGNRQHDKTQNRFECNGHQLTFRSTANSGDATSNAIRFRYTSTFVDPTTVVLDGLGITTTAAYGTFYVVDSEDRNMKLPCLKFVNASRLNIQNGKITRNIKAFDFEFGTTIGKVGSDDAGSGTLAEVIGCPGVTDQQSVTISDAFTARKADFGMFGYLDSASALAFGPKCRVRVDLGDPADPDYDPSFGSSVIAASPTGTMSGSVIGIGCHAYFQDDGDKAYLKISEPTPSALLLR